MKKRTQSLILQTEGKNKIRQWHISYKKLSAIICTGVCLMGLLLFLTADTLTGYFYRFKLNNIRSNYSHVATTLSELNTQLEILNNKISELEKQDTELRKFSGLPLIDDDIREVGIGGVRLTENFDITFPEKGFNPGVSNLEINVDALARKVKLELNSFYDIHQKILENKEKLAHIPSIQPVTEGYLNSGFGYRKDPFDGIRRFHHGQDFSVYRGAPIQSPADGTVKRTGYRGGFGKYIIIDHGYGYETKYLHLSKINVKKGQSVVRGELIGATGNSGRSTAPHLHYEVIYNGTPQNPLNYFYRG
jgi:murein DD-endopeptidase MepM/ murein hydrolase activator NlpD